MKKSIALKGTIAAFLFFIVTSTTIAQQKFKFGEVSMDDLKMSAYPTDTSAVAAVLHENCDVWYDINANGIFIVKKYIVQIKILKEAGLSYADFSIPYYYGSKSESEDVSGIGGNTFNINEANGKIERTKLTKEYIFEEKTLDTYRRKKIAFPNVKVGSIIDFKYEITSPHYASLSDFLFQKTIPVRYSGYSVTIPEYFRFSKQTLGYENVTVNETKENLFFFIDGGRLACIGNKMKFETFNLPAMKDDDYVWNKNDFMTKVTFDLAGVAFPRSTYKSFAHKWEDIDKQLLEDENFGKQFSYSNLLKNELAAILKPEMSDNDKASAILELVKEKVKWNETNTLYSKSVKNALKEGKGSSGEMNALLICLLKDAGFSPYPVVMSLRGRGRVLKAQPSIKKLNYFIVGVDLDGKPAYMDASTKYGSINVISNGCMVENARVIQKGKPSQWVDLQNIKKNVTMNRLIVGFNEDGILKGEMLTQKSGLQRVLLCIELDKEDGLNEYKKKLESNWDISIDELEITGYKEVSSSTKETYSFVNKNITLDDEYIYINPLIIPYIKENQFKAETRNLPIEFPYPYNHIQTVMFSIPEGYKVDEVPLSEKIILNDGNIIYSYIIKHDEKSIQVTQSISVQKTIYTSLDYKYLRDFWAKIANKNAAQSVLKRIE